MGCRGKCILKSEKCHFVTPPLVAPYCAIPRDYLSDTPLLRAMGFLVSQHGQLGAIPPSHLLSVSPPLESMRSRGAIPPPQKGYLSDTCAMPMKTRQIGAIPPSAILSRKGIARYGGVSRTGPLSTPPPKNGPKIQSKIQNVGNQACKACNHAALFELSSCPYKSGTENQPKEEVLGRISLRTSGKNKHGAMDISSGESGK